MKRPAKTDLDRHRADLTQLAELAEKRQLTAEEHAWRLVLEKAIGKLESS